MAQARRFNGMTQVHAATACGVPPRTYQNWERDEREPTISGLKGLARATGFPIMYFIGDDGDAKTPTPPDGGVPSGGVSSDVGRAGLEPATGRLRVLMAA